MHSIPQDKSLIQARQRLLARFRSAFGQQRVCNRVVLLMDEVLSLSWAKGGNLARPVVVGWRAVVAEHDVAGLSDSLVGWPPIPDG